MTEAVRRAAEWSGWPLSPAHIERLERLATWLKSEAVQAGALGPNEAGRVHDRHVADSLLFAAAWSGPDPPPRLTDLGSGAGLPGLPLAILWPHTRVMLVERRGRRADLLRRAVRVLSLDNVTVEQADAARLSHRAEMVTARAAAPAPQVRDWARNILAAGGVAVIGGSWQARPDPHPDDRVVEVPAEVLDRPVWLRIMAAS